MITIMIDDESVAQGSRTDDHGDYSILRGESNAASLYSYS